jgi:hypothetical protein
MHELGPIPDVIRFTRGTAIYSHRRFAVKKLKVALVVPGGVDRSGDYRVIPVLLALIERLARVVDLRQHLQHRDAGHHPARNRCDPS